MKKVLPLLFLAPLFVNADVVSEKTKVQPSQMLEWFVTARTQRVENVIAESRRGGKWALSDQRVIKWEWAFPPPEAADLKSDAAAKAVLEAADTSDNAISKYTLRERTLLKILFDIVNDVRSRHGQGNLTRQQFENNVLQPAYQWGKDNP